MIKVQECDTARGRLGCVDHAPHYRRTVISYCPYGCLRDDWPTDRSRRPANTEQRTHIYNVEGCYRVAGRPRRLYNFPKRREFAHGGAANARLFREGPLEGSAARSERQESGSTASRSRHLD